jgi:hypothetical protein
VWSLGLTVFGSAFLLFSVQPYAGRLLLPALGGVPSAWTACLLFFQAVLLLGYGWSWALARIPHRSTRIGLHLLLLLGAMLALPPAAPELAAEGATASPVGFALVFLARAVGVPFFALTTTAPMLQAWLASSDDPARARPYPLYAASNAGSLGSLLAYPLLVEPLLTLSEQARAFTGGFVVVAALAGISGAMALRRRAETETGAETGAETETETETGTGTETGERWAQRGRWLGWAFVPSALLATLSSYLSVDLAPVPLLWIVPLAAYLATFVIAFGRPDAALPAWLSRIARLLAAALVVATGVHANSPLALLVALHLGFFFLAALVVHRRLAASAPPAARLTEFYVTTALGGALGTLVFGVLPTLLLPDAWEHAIAIALGAGLTIPVAASEGWRPDLMRAALVLAVALGLVAALPALGLGDSAFGPLLVFGAPVLLAYRESERPRRYALALLAIVVAGATYSERGTSLLRRERDFFGVLRVLDDDGMRVLLHGTTLHGAQRIDERDRCEPLAYYARSGPLGRVLAARRAAFARPIEASAIGLGAGSTACYAAPGERWTFHEISGAVASVASDPALFTYLANAPGEITVRIDDGRAGLAATEAGRLDLVIVDAFNSDSVPVHLLTREAIALYQRALREDGWLLLHVSNRSLNLVRVVAALVEAEGLAARVNADASEVGGSGEQPSWIVIARSEAPLAGLSPALWTTLPPSPLRPWSDERSSLLDALR